MTDLPKADSQEFRERVGRIDELVREIESVADPALRASTRELVQSLMDLHGAAVSRMLEVVSRAGEAGEGILKSLGRDELVSALLVLYDLHPDSFETRVNRGLEKARKKLSRHSASLEVLEMSEQTVHVRVQVNGHTCGSTTNELQSTVRDALYESAPDALDVLIEAPQEQAASRFVPLASLQPANGSHV
ncbi:MAG: hypothetical protein WB992_16690 [Bryobacteraceae bacterium]